MEYSESLTSILIWQSSAWILGYNPVLHRGSDLFFQRDWTNGATLHLQQRLSNYTLPVWWSWCFSLTSCGRDASSLWGPALIYRQVLSVTILWLPGHLRLNRLRWHFPWTVVIYDAKFPPRLLNRFMASLTSNVACIMRNTSAWTF